MAADGAARTCASVRIVTSTDISEQWAARLHDIATEEDVQGAVLGVWVDGQESVAAHGVLNAATGVSATPDALFQIGSITKVWTTTMIMQLIDEGRLSLDTTVAEILPGVRLGHEDASAEVRIDHLLTHASGIDGDNFTDTGRGADCVPHGRQLRMPAASRPALGPDGLRPSRRPDALHLLQRPDYTPSPISVLAITLVIGE